MKPPPEYIPDIPGIYLPSSQKMNNRQNIIREVYSYSATSEASPKKFRPAESLLQDIIDKWNLSSSGGNYLDIVEGKKFYLKVASCLPINSFPIPVPWNGHLEIVGWEEVDKTIFICSKSPTQRPLEQHILKKIPIYKNIRKHNSKRESLAAQADSEVRDYEKLESKIFKLSG